jgi:hypothetical protein
VTFQNIDFVLAKPMIQPITQRYNAYEVTDDEVPVHTTKQLRIYFPPHLRLEPLDIVLNANFKASSVLDGELPDTVIEELCRVLNYVISSGVAKRTNDSQVPMLWYSLAGFHYIALVVPKESESIWIIDTSSKRARKVYNEEKHLKGHAGKINKCLKQFDRTNAEFVTGVHKQLDNTSCGILSVLYGYFVLQYANTKLRRIRESNARQWLYTLLHEGNWIDPKDFLY